MQTDTQTHSAGLAVGLDPRVESLIRRRGIHLHVLGARSVQEVLLVWAAGPGGSAPVLDVLEPYDRLTPAMILAAGADHPLRPRLKVAP